MNSCNRITVAFLVVAGFARIQPEMEAAAADIRFEGSATELQSTLDQAEVGSTIVCELAVPIAVETITISKPLKVIGLKARLPDGLIK